MKISHDFDSGSITVLDTTDINNIQLELKADNSDNTMQWFKTVTPIQL
ncbi:MAG: hypothetical protein GY787_22415 [Alteromonadales bacterium]|nr:hypothetical protein [Alteromonadales bacterium]